MNVVIGKGVFPSLIAWSVSLDQIITGPNGAMNVVPFFRHLSITDHLRSWVATEAFIRFFDGSEQRFVLLQMSDNFL